MKTLIFAVVAQFALIGIANAQTKDPWIGKRVFTQFGAVLKVGGKEVDDEGRSASLKTNGKDQTYARVYRVEHVNGNWLWLQDENSGVCGWVDSNYVVPFDQAIELYTSKIKAQPSVGNYTRRGSIWLEKGEYDNATADFNEAIRLDPGNATCISNRGRVWNLKKSYDKAIADFDEAIRLDPKDADTYVHRGIAWTMKKDYEKSIADFDEAIRLNPNEYGNYVNMAYVNRGIVWTMKKDYEKAIADFNEAIRLAPKDARPYYIRAWLWATRPDDRIRDARKAVESAARACELDNWKSAVYLDGLAAAYAESGDFDKAVEWQEKAISLMKPENKKGYEFRLSLYKEKKPYRGND